MHSFSLDDQLRELLVCPRDRTPLRDDDGDLRCEQAHRYPVLDGIPILLVEEAPRIYGAITRTLEMAAGTRPRLEYPQVPAGTVDPFVQENAVHVCGKLYAGAVETLPRYPIPRLPLPDGGGKVFLEIGCSWGRWCVAAARSGYRPIGIDLGLPGIEAARRIARELEVDASFLVADGRFLPFRDDSVDVAFSYSVLQHLPRDATTQTAAEIGRVLVPGGRALVQMANRYGIRNNVLRLRSLGRLVGGNMRYWSPGELEALFRRHVGAADVRADGFFTLNPQTADLDLLPATSRTVVRLSERLRRVSTRLPAVARIADSIYVDAVAE